LTNFSTGDRDSPLTPKKNSKDSELRIKNHPKLANSPTSSSMMLPEVKRTIMETIQAWRKEET
jgi:hypothetical protein